MATKKTTEKTTTKKTPVKKTPVKAAKKPSTSELLAALVASVAELKALVPATTASRATQSAAPSVELKLSERSSWARKTDMPSYPECKRLLLAGSKGKLREEEEELAHLVRELNADFCLFCEEKSDPTMAPPTPWEDVKLCNCAAMRSRKGREGKAFQTRHAERPQPPAATPLLAGWGEARAAADGGIEWLRERMVDGRVWAQEPVYTGHCRCGQDFTITAGMVARSVQSFGLDKYVESRKCLGCVKKAERWRAENGVAPKKARLGGATLRDVMPGVAS